MCGICGVLGAGDSDTIQTMLETLVHRGPDDGHWVGQPDFCLGARRLSIVDVDAGRQPVTNETQTVFAVQNGEIYNFPTIRERLLQDGHSLKTRCDTEVLPHLYEEYGTRAASKTHGMFAFAIWDSKSKVGVLARDRMGKKPLYYHSRGDALYFASELKAILQIPGFEKRINAEAMHHYLSYKHVPHPLCIFEGIKMMPPAHTLVFRPGQEPVLERYWQADFTPSDELAGLTEDEIAERLLSYLRQGIERRLMSDVPIGFFLSGGIDSSLTTALAAEMSSSRVKTFTLAYSHESSNRGKDEDQRWATYVADKYDTEHHEEVVEFSYFPDAVKGIISCFDEPFCGVVSTYFLSELISRHVKVAISGDGADELFGSYLSHRLAFPLANFNEWQGSRDPDLIRPFEDELPFLRGLSEPQDWAWRYKLLVYSDEEKRGIYCYDLATEMATQSTERWLREGFSGLSACDPLNRMLEAEFRTVFPDQVLTFVDRLSMAHSLEVRSAFLDTDFVNFVTALPGNYKIRNGETKYILKKACLKFFPPEMVFRQKEGFLMPITQWLLQDLESYVRDMLCSEKLRRQGIFDPEAVQSLVDELYQGDVDYKFVNKVFSLVMFQEWHDVYIP